MGSGASTTKNHTAHGAVHQIKSKCWPVFRAGLEDGLMKGKFVAITGCTSGTGFVLACTAVELMATVIMVNRPSKRHDEAFEMLSGLAKKLGAPQPLSVMCDLQSFTKSKAAGDKLAQLCKDSGLDVLCNNAGIMAFADKATEDGVDVQMATNHLGHWILTAKAMGVLELGATKRGEARIVNHSSALRVHPDKNHTQKLEAKYLEKNGGNLGGDKTSPPMNGQPWIRYQQTKLANLVFTYALRDRLATAKSKIKALVAHPGVAPTKLMVNTGKGGAVAPMSKFMSWIFSKVYMQSQEDGSMGITLCCLKPGVKNGEFYGPLGKKYKPGVHDTGGYVGPAVLMPEELLGDKASREMLWTTSEAVTGMKLEIAFS